MLTLFTIQISLRSLSYFTQKDKMQPGMEVMVNTFLKQICDYDFTILILDIWYYSLHN